MCLRVPLSASLLVMDVWRRWHCRVLALQAFALAELLDSLAQVRAVGLIIASLRVAVGCNEEGYDNLITRWVGCICALCV